MKNVLILCTGNSCRSILGEVLLNDLSRGRYCAFSAGSNPTGQINPNALAVLKSHGHSIDGLSSKSWNDFEQQPVDLIISVCDSAAGESCPVYLGDAMRAHWGLPDPAHATGTKEQIYQAFENTYAALELRIQAMLALPVNSLGCVEFVSELNNISIQNSEEILDGR